MAGLNAGAQFNTFPLMAGQVIPDGLFVQEPWFRNVTENPMTLQFNHRYLAMTTGLAVLTLWQLARKIPLTRTARLALNLSAGMVLVQVSLGVATLLSICGFRLLLYIKQERRFFLVGVVSSRNVSSAWALNSSQSKRYARA